jgi:hypothetical protein
VERVLKYCRFNFLGILHVLNSQGLDLWESDSHRFTHLSLQRAVEPDRFSRDSFVIVLPRNRRCNARRLPIKFLRFGVQQPCVMMRVCVEFSKIRSKQNRRAKKELGHRKDITQPAQAG